MIRKIVNEPSVNDFKVGDRVTLNFSFHGGLTYGHPGRVIGFEGGWVVVQFDGVDHISPMYPRNIELVRPDTLFDRLEKVESYMGFRIGQRVKSRIPFIWLEVGSEGEVVEFDRGSEFPIQVRWDSVGHTLMRATSIESAEPNLFDRFEKSSWPGGFETGDRVILHEDDQYDANRDIVLRAGMEGVVVDPAEEVQGYPQFNIESARSEGLIPVKFDTPLNEIDPRIRLGGAYSWLWVDAAHLAFLGSKPGALFDRLEKADDSSLDFAYWLGRYHALSADVFTTLDADPRGDQEYGRILGEIDKVASNLFGWVVRKKLSLGPEFRRIDRGWGDAYGRAEKAILDYERKEDSKEYAAASLEALMDKLRDALNIVAGHFGAGPIAKVYMEVHVGDIVESPETAEGLLLPDRTPIVIPRKTRGEVLGHEEMPGWGHIKNVRVKIEDIGEVLIRGTFLAFRGRVQKAAPPKIGDRVSLVSGGYHFDQDNNEENLTTGVMGTIVEEGEAGDDPWWWVVFENQEESEYGEVRRFVVSEPDLRHGNLFDTLEKAERFKVGDRVRLLADYPIEAITIHAGAEGIVSDFFGDPDDVVVNFDGMGSGPDSAYVINASDLESLEPPEPTLFDMLEKSDENIIGVVVFEPGRETTASPIPSTRERVPRRGPPTPRNPLGHLYYIYGPPSDEELASRGSPPLYRFGEKRGPLVSGGRGQAVAWFVSVLELRGMDPSDADSIVEYAVDRPGRMVEVIEVPSSHERGPSTVDLRVAPGVGYMPEEESRVPGEGSSQGEDGGDDLFSRLEKAAMPPTAYHWSGGMVGRRVKTLQASVSAINVYPPGAPGPKIGREVGEQSVPKGSSGTVLAWWKDPPSPARPTGLGAVLLHYDNPTLKDGWMWDNDIESIGDLFNTLEKSIYDRMRKDDLFDFSTPGGSGKPAGDKPQPMPHMVPASGGRTMPVYPKTDGHQTSGGPVGLRARVLQDTKGQSDDQVDDEGDDLEVDLTAGMEGEVVAYWSEGSHTQGVEIDFDDPDLEDDHLWLMLGEVELIGDPLQNYGVRKGVTESDGIKRWYDLSRVRAEWDVDEEGWDVVDWEHLATVEVDYPVHERDVVDLLEGKGGVHDPRLGGFGDPKYQIWNLVHDQLFQVIADDTGEPLYEVRQVDKPVPPTLFDSLEKVRLFRKGDRVRLDDIGEDRHRTFSYDTTGEEVRLPGGLEGAVTRDQPPNGAYVPVLYDEHKSYGPLGTFHLSLILISPAGGLFSVLEKDDERLFRKGDRVHLAHSGGRRQEAWSDTAESDEPMMIPGNNDGVVTEDEIQDDGLVRVQFGDWELFGAVWVNRDLLTLLPPGGDLFTQLLKAQQLPIRIIVARYPPKRTPEEEDLNRRLLEAQRAEVEADSPLSDSWEPKPRPDNFVLTTTFTNMTSPNVAGPISREATLHTLRGFYGLSEDAVRDVIARADSRVDPQPTVSFVRSKGSVNISGAGVASRMWKLSTPLVTPGSGVMSPAPQTGLHHELQLRLEPNVEPRTKASSGLVDKLKAFRGSPLWIALVGYILNEEWTDPRIIGLWVDGGGLVLSAHSDDPLFNYSVGDISDVRQNWVRYIAAAGLTPAERAEAEALYRERVPRPGGEPIYLPGSEDAFLLADEVERTPPEDDVEKATFRQGLRNGARVTVISQQAWGFYMHPKAGGMILHKDDSGIIQDESTLPDTTFAVVHFDNIADGDVPPETLLVRQVDLIGDAPTLFDTLEKAIVQKPFAGMKNFASCLKKMEPRYGKAGARRVCGSLIHRFEKGATRWLELLVHGGEDYALLIYDDNRGEDWRGDWKEVGEAMGRAGVTDRQVSQLLDAAAFLKKKAEGDSPEVEEEALANGLKIEGTFYDDMWLFAWPDTGVPNLFDTLEKAETAWLRIEAREAGGYYLEISGPDDITMGSEYLGDWPKMVTLLDRAGVGHYEIANLRISLAELLHGNTGRYIEGTFRDGEWHFEAPPPPTLFDRLEKETATSTTGGVK